MAGGAVVKALAVLALAALLAGCGVKGPPVAPSEPSPTHETPARP